MASRRWLSCPGRVYVVRYWKEINLQRLLAKLEQLPIESFSWNGDNFNVTIEDEGIVYYQGERSDGTTINITIEKGDNYQSPAEIGAEEKA